MAFQHLMVMTVLMVVVVVGDVVLALPRPHHDCYEIVRGRLYHP